MGFRIRGIACLLSYLFQKSFNGNRNIFKVLSDAPWKSERVGYPHGDRILRLATF